MAAKKKAPPPAAVKPDAPPVATPASLDTDALLDELRDRVLDTASDDALINECRKRGFPPYDADVDGVLLKDADYGQIVEQLEKNGDDRYLLDLDDADRLAELIAERRIDDALDLLRRMAPDAIHPSTIKRLVADRRALSVRSMFG